MSLQMKSCYCGHCQIQVMAVRNGHTVRNVLSVPLSLGVTAKVEKWICPNCARPIDGSDLTSKPLLSKTIGDLKADRRARQAGTPGKTVWACEKNCHKLGRNRTVCPIDGSPVGWREPEA